VTQTEPVRRTFETGTSADGVVYVVEPVAVTLGDEPVPAHTHTAGQVTGLDAALAGKQPLHATLTGIAAISPTDDTVIVRRAGAWTTRTYAQLKADMGILESVPTAPLFDVEQHGAVADGVTDNYAAFLSAWNAMLAFSVGGVLFGPSIGTYRVALTPARVQVWPDKQRAAFPIPLRPRTSTKLAYGIRGVGEAYTVRAAELGGTPGQVATATVFHFDYDPTLFAWSATTGLPSVFGCVDADMTDMTGNTFSHVHFTIDDVILRNTPNPSLCLVNAEQCSTVRIGRARFDVNVVLDDVPLPTRPTGAAFLLPRSNNNVACQVDSVVVEGHFTGAQLHEHGELRRAIALRCRIGVFTRRPNSHAGHVGTLKIEQCPWGISGWDPSAATAADAVVPFHGWLGVIGSLDFEDYAYNGERPEFYAPVSGAHLNDPNGAMTGEIAQMFRINSEDPEGSPSGGIGIGPQGGSHSLYVIGPGGTTASPVAIYGPHHDQAATRLLPPSAPSVTEHRLFAGQDGPAAAPTEGAGINVGIKVRASAACEAVALMFWRVSTDVNPTAGRLWRHDRVADTWTSLGDVTFTPAGTAVWVRSSDLTPVALQTEAQAPDVEYVATIHYDANYPRTGDYWGGGPGGSGLVVLPLKAYSDTDAGGQGCFSMGAITVPPTLSGSGADYGVDLVVTTEA
jgi:hypothetical protein